MHTRKLLGRFFLYAALCLVALTILFPLYLALLTALKRPMDAQYFILALPPQPTLANFEQVITKGGFFSALGNSAYISILSTACAIFVNIVLSYFLSRNGHKRFFSLAYYYFVFGIFIPFQVVMIPLAVMARSMHLLNREGLCLIYVALSFSMNVFLMTDFVKTIPRSIDEAAMIDGAGPFRCLFSVISPMLKPIIMTCGILAFLGYWNDFSLPLIILQVRKFRTLPLFIYNYRTKYLTNYNLAFAAYTLTMIPPIIVYIFAQKHIVNGVTAGAVKG